MATVRPCLLLLVTLVSHRLAAGSPIFGASLLCSLLCDDYDDSSYDDFLSMLSPCAVCSSSDSDSETASGSTNESEESDSGGTQGPVKVVIPPATGVNVTLENVHGAWSINLFPWLTGGSSSAQSTTAAPAAAATTAAAAGNGTATTAATTAKA